MIERATGLVLRTRPLTETSLIVHWITAGHGRLATVAKGARRPKSPFRGKLDLFFLADFAFSRSRRSELHTLREVSPRETHHPLRQDLATLRQACYAAALVEQTTETETPLPGIFALVAAFLARVTGHPARPEMIFALELKLLTEFGQQPDPSRSELSTEALRAFTTLTREDWPAIADLRLERAVHGEIDRFLRAFLVMQLGKFPRNRAAALIA